MQKIKIAVKEEDEKPQYGGTTIRLMTLPVGTKFFVRNGAWDGEIVMHKGIKSLCVVDIGRIHPIKEDDVLDIDIKEDEKEE
jgi:hypothetical protein